MKVMGKVSVGFFVVALLFSNGIFAMERDGSEEEIERTCESEARTAGIMSEEEVHDYVSQCVEELMMEQESDGVDFESASQE